MSSSLFSNPPIHLLITGGVIAALIAAFLVFFLLPGVIHWFRLHKLLNRLKALPPQTSLDKFRKFFASDKQLAYLWDEYQDTLHRQEEAHDGQMQLVAVRSTVAAETFFNEQFVVDSRLHTEFFKHLPGIFTGLGIIGTFTGLIEGLRSFQVSDNAATARTSLEALMHAVGNAFLISAGAIAAAMIATFLEKMLLAALYRQTERIAHSIDAQFQTGAGEEYLSRLVRASEDSASQAKILKDALVKELGDVLQKLTSYQVKANQHFHTQLAQRIEASTTQQVEAANANSQNLSKSISDSIEQSLRAPLNQIADSVKTASSDQSANAVQILNDVMVSFSQRLNDLFGGQISGINALSQQTSQAMQEAVASLHTLVNKLEESGRKSTDDMAAQMAAAIQAMEQRQASINEQTQAFVEQIRQLVQSSQAETQHKLHATLEAMGQQMGQLLGQLGQSQAQVFEDHRARETLMAERTSTAVSAMTGSVEAAAKEMAAASQTMAQSVATLTASTATTVDKMSAGAQRLDTAATHFAQAGDRVSAVMAQAATVGTKLNELSGSLTSSAGAVQTALQDYKAQRDSVSALLTDLRAAVEHARREASLTGDVLQRIEAAATKLNQAQTAADAYLDGVSQVLADSSDAFQNAVVSTLGKVNHEFHDKLSSAVVLLSTAVQELEVTLGSLGSSQAPRR